MLGRLRKKLIFDKVDYLFFVAFGLVGVGILINLAVRNLIFIYISILTAWSILLFSPMFMQVEKRVRSLFIFGLVVVVTYPIIELLFAPLTRWGYYTTNDFKILKTPLYIPWFFGFLAVIIAYLSQRVLRTTSSSLLAAISAGASGFILTAIGENLGRLSGLWVYNGFKHWVYVAPLFVPLSYSLSFFVLPFLQKVNSAVRGIMFVLIVGISWIITYYFCEKIF